MIATCAVADPRIEEIQRALNAGILPRDYYALAEQHAAGFGPDVRVVIAAVVDERDVGAVGDRHGVDAERRHVDLVRGALVVVGPRLEVGAHDERASLDEHVVAGHFRRGRRRLLATRVGVVAQLQRRQHRLVVLVLVLHDHAVDETLIEQRPAVLDQWNAVEHVQHPAPYVTDGDEQLGHVVSEVHKADKRVDHIAKMDSKPDRLEKAEKANSDKIKCIKSRCSGLVLDVLEASREDGARVVQWGLYGEKNQQWELVEVK